MSVVFITPCQLILVLGSHVLPIDIATVILEMLFLVAEIILACNTMINVSRKQANVYYLRNTATNTYSQEKTIKTSQEIEEEVLFNFPKLNLQNSVMHEKIY